ncbi:MAG: methylmalonyl Co-A mutase-associated GTPase MeaB [Anaerolineaceae bacterium]|nr:methylmalonyl Co-A mutase-associated GTPase MeaB [Anaerolineaceae bacterium]
MIAAEDIRAGKRLAISRFLSEVENDTSQGRDLMNALFSFTGKAYYLGVTGAPGTGKSTLVNELVLCVRKQTPWRIGIIAVDPSSPFSGGALLGDRIRMRDLYGDDGVFIRSMASRGALGGLALRTAAVASALDAAGFDLIVIETVGAGQSEVDIARLAHTVLVVEAPGFGDDIQAIKAGILEIADILVVNKADQTGADHTVLALQTMLNMSTLPRQGLGDMHHGFSSAQATIKDESSSDNKIKANWQIPVIKTSATERDGIEQLFEAIQSHRDYLLASGLMDRKNAQRILEELHQLLRKSLFEKWREQIDDDSFNRDLDLLRAKKISPQALVEKLVKYI